MATSVSWEQVRAFRMQRHGLAVRRPASEMLEVAGDICGLHAQLMSSAELTLWARLDGLAPDAVGRALWEDRTLVKIWAFRGTLHLVTAGDYWTWQAALSTYRHYLKSSWSKYFGVTPDDVSAMVQAMARALDGRLLTRQELATAVAEEIRPELAGRLLESWGALLKPASFQGKLCFAPSAGQNVRFTLPAWWLGRQEEVDPEAAVDAVTRRFLRANGPASREDYGRWWAVSPAQALARIRRLGDEVAQVDVEGVPGWMLAADVERVAAAAPEGTVNLLPAFDQYVVTASKHAERLMPGPFRERIYRPQGWLSPVLLVDGRMDGVWAHVKKGGRLSVTVEPFVSLSRQVKEKAEQEAKRLAAFLDCDRCELSVNRS